MVKFIQVKKVQEYNVMERKADAHFELEEIWLNPDWIHQINPDPAMKYNFSKGYLPEGLVAEQQFSKLHYGTGNNISVSTVIGSPEAVVEKIYKSSSKEILKG